MVAVSHQFGIREAMDIERISPAAKIERADGRALIRPRDSLRHQGLTCLHFPIVTEFCLHVCASAWPWASLALACALASPRRWVRWETTRSDVQSLASMRDTTTAEMTSRRFVLRRGWPWNRRKAQTICNLRDVLVHGIECFPLAIDFSEVHPLQPSGGLVALDNWHARRRTPRSVPV